MTLSRRDAVRSLALGAGGLALPTWPAVAKARPDSTKPPMRFLFVLQSNGFHSWAAQPKGLARTEKGPDRPLIQTLRDFEFTEDLSPLEPLKHRTTIIQRLSGVHAKPRHSADFGALAGVATPAGPTAETVDAALARALPAPVSLVNLGIYYPHYRSEQPGNQPREPLRDHLEVCSGWGPGKPIRTTVNPEVAHRELFGPGSPGAGEDRFAFVEDDDVRAGIRPGLDDRYRSHVETKRLEAQFELAAAALVGGLTNVVTIASGACNFYGYFEGLGFDRKEMHSVGHYRPGEQWRQIYTAMRKFNFELIAEVYRKLNAIPEGNGTMMDNTCIVYTSDGADAHHSKGHEWPFVIVGGLQNTLRTDAFIEYPAYGKTGNRTINALYCTLLNAAGVECDQFNLTGERAKLDRHGPLEELLR